ncbi:uroporphyrin-III C-methyltransferase [Rhizina undulata]
MPRKKIVSSAPASCKGRDYIHTTEDKARIMPGLLPAPGLLASVDCSNQVHLVIGSNAIAGARCGKSLDVGAKVKIIAPETEELHYGLNQRIEAGEVEWVRREFLKEDLTTLGREEVDGVVDLVWVTLPVGCAQCAYISNLCRRLRIPVNVTDSPTLCTFTLLSTYSDGPLQIGVTTSGNGCKMASRIRREIVSTLPKGLGEACTRIGQLRRRLWEEDHGEGLINPEEEEDASDQKSTFNALITPEDASMAKTRRIRWLSQVCEYWPLSKLAALDDDVIESVLASYNSGVEAPDEVIIEKRGRIQLVGSGPGHPDLLTMASLKAIQSAELVLADKLVPAPVLDLVPRRAQVYIARKFPGNADKAQEELLEMGLQGLRKGLNVVRLKQGDPYIYGRGGEEYNFFSSQGYTPIVLPGITSSLSAPLFAAIPATHRGVADQVLICTGTGRKGAALDPPEFVASRTVVFLMALHRLSSLVESLVDGKKWPKEVPCAVIERASCPDQRVIRTTLESVVHAVEEEGSRPPGLIVVGWACDVLKKGGKKWVVEEGFSIE